MTSRSLPNLRSNTPGCHPWAPHHSIYLEPLTIEHVVNENRESAQNQEDRKKIHNEFGEDKELEKDVVKDKIDDIILSLQVTIEFSIAADISYLIVYACVLLVFIPTSDSMLFQVSGCFLLVRFIFVFFYLIQLDSVRKSYCPEDIDKTIKKLCYSESIHTGIVVLRIVGCLIDMVFLFIIHESRLIMGLIAMEFALGFWTAIHVFVHFIKIRSSKKCIIELRKIADEMNKTQ
ncbi:XK-related protein [Caenorhabditis elegans]|uniref:XK-related protein n=1 Tax=Caenorhabditis elegans TaxID=6239 RepID=H2L267_CAEEL|nr:XK-related protein [Caenorhabditis elegans]CCE71520.1 XK-related protein [Caenorhabditis elegans]|eukprot:NP_001255055.1 Uncharacterized protein CELE_C05B5.16 [Caenorhabditis elegans]